MYAAEHACVIIGAGPAGLAAAAGAQSLNPIVFESGRSVRERSQEDYGSIVEGVGGAGLYSDGKFSFWPSASGLWSLDRRLLESSYAWFVEKVHYIDIIAPEFPSYPSGPQSHNNETRSRTPGPPRRIDKSYKSVYASQSSRAQLIDALAKDVRIETGVRAESVDRIGDSWTVKIWDGTREHDVKCNQIVVASGRFGTGLANDVLPTTGKRLLRLEVGVRIEQPFEHFFLRNDPRVDPKIVYEDPAGSVSWRTFCCCRRGLIAATCTHRIVSVSGRADCAPTAMSNVGFNVRLLDPGEIESEWSALRQRLATVSEPVRTTLRAMLSDSAPDARAEDLRRILGPVLTARLSEGLARLVSDFPDQHLPMAHVIGPTVEGVGVYPTHGDSLATSAPGLWVAGDVTGSFRGLTAALISGHIAGQAARGGTS